MPTAETAVTIDANASSYLFDTLKVSEARLVFRNDSTGNLTYIRFSRDSAQAVEFVSELNVYHPTISPDGKWVAFGTSPEPVGTYSEVYVQELGPESSIRVSLGGPAAIPRWRIINGDTVLIYVTSAGVNRKDDFWKEQSTYMVSFKDGAFGMPQKILEGNYHGGISDDMRLAVTGAHFLRVHTKIQGEERDTIWYDSLQICNVSLSTDGSLRTIFLDLGAERGRIFSGEDYLAHHRILIADSVGNLIGSIPSPEPYSFDQPEWVFGSDFLLTAMKTSDVHETLLLVDIRDSSVHSLVSGSDLWHPDVWLQP
ncbi:hypothetical protein [Fibrobacter intestinalis]|uniref:hypothetical protein n=1 Tax=Fibrobacter TaxID=832 RepID=UPI001179F7BD|nr:MULTISPECIES: hypothetical protein [Fibrobacter]